MECSLAPTSWDLGAELNAVERRDRRRKGVTEKDSVVMKNGRKESKQERKERLQREEQAFDEDA